jgi:hypothetical protein
MRVAIGGATQTTTPAVGIAESPVKSFCARLGAKFKLILEWMRERLFFRLR